MRDVVRLSLAALFVLTPVSAAHAEAGGGGWYLSAFAGGGTADDTSDIATGDITLGSGPIGGAAVGTRIAPLTGDLDIGAEAIVERYFGDQDYWQFDIVAYLQWRTFPWERRLRTTFSLGMGPSLASKVPPLERETHGADQSARLTNFVFGELAFGLPAAPETDVTLRYHHRSGIFGLVNNVGEGSTAFLLGLKRRF